ncbi:Protein prune like [Quillaja saponaria]|uniref:Protein prune like n=1 Tax=Quillaja saponaria TaxID=32244 RepID=A0AAD7KND0_QUISA|nr:Protein prune like [Quillaja saponaria]
MKSPNGRQEQFIRTREDPFFNGLLRGGDQVPPFDFQVSAGNKNILRSMSDIGDPRHRKVVSDIHEEVSDLPLEDSVSDIVIESSELLSSDKWSKNPKTNSFALLNTQSDLSFNLSDPKDFENGSSPNTSEADQDNHTLALPARPIFEKLYSVNKRKENLSSIPLPESAASFYNGYSPEVEIVELSGSITKLNAYLKARRDDVSAGVPGRFLRAVIGQYASDVGTVASAIMYAFYLNETQKTDQFCTVPIINMKRADLNSHAELKWLLDSCHIDQSSLIFVDEIDLLYYDLYGSLMIVLLNSNKIPKKQEELREAVIEIFNCRKGDTIYPWVANITPGEDCSCCTIIAEKFAEYSPEILTGQGFSRLLLAGILLDTANLSKLQCTSKDKYIATLLINGAGRYGCSGLYQILKYKMYDTSALNVADILRKDLKKWAEKGSRLESQMGMSSVAISFGQLLYRKEMSAQEIKYFQRSEKLQLLVIVSGYNDAQKNFKRELLVSTDSGELLRNLLYFFNLKDSELPLKILNQPGLKDEMKAFEIDKITSRKTIERLMEEFAGISKDHKVCNVFC